MANSSAADLPLRQWIARVMGRGTPLQPQATQPDHGLQAVVPGSGGYLSLHGVRKEYPGSGGQPIPVLSSIDFEMQAGEFVALDRAPRAGQTPLVEKNSGLLPPTPRPAQLRGRA